MQSVLLPDLDILRWGAAAPSGVMNMLLVDTAVVIRRLLTRVIRYTRYEKNEGS